MTKKCLDELIETVTTLKNDVKWIKQLIYVSAGASITTTIGFVFDLLIRR